MPAPIAVFAASCAALDAAKADDFRLPEKFILPADAQATTLPEGSVMVTIVLLKVALINAMPLDTVRTFFRRALVGVFFELPVCLAKIYL
jgi:hypothetical protein